MPAPTPCTRHIRRIVLALSLCATIPPGAQAAPAITSQPSSQETEYGGYAHLTVAATGDLPSYQWFRGASGDTAHPVENATSAHLLTPPLVEATEFWVRVSDTSGSTDSVAALITPGAPLAAALSVAGAQRLNEFGGGSEAYALTRPIPLPPDIAAVASVGPLTSGHTLALRSDGTLLGAGLNDSGQLGLGDTAQRGALVTITNGVSAIAAGGAHSLFIRTDGTLWAMGLNSSRQLGDGTTTDRLSPVQVADNVTDIAAGHTLSLYRKTDGSLWAMGNPGYPTPTQIADSVTTMAVGSQHFVFLKDDGSLWGAGANGNGQLGTGDTTTRATPVQIATSVVAVAAHARGSHTLFLRADGTLFGMGFNAFGQLGTGDQDNRHSPAVIATGVLSVSTGARHSAYITADHVLWTVGANNVGQLGLGLGSDLHQPAEIATDVASVACSAFGTIFTDHTGTKFGMGLNNEGQLGFINNAHLPSLALLATDVRSAQAAPYRSTRLSTEGDLWVSSGEVTTGLPYASIVADGVVCVLPNTVAKPTNGGAETTSISLETFFIHSDGSLWGMGRNTFGQLGTGDTLPRSSPVKIADGVVSAAAGSNHVAFLKNDLSLWLTGRLMSGAGGVDAPLQHLTPTLLDDNVVSLTTSAYHVLYLKTDDTLWGVGDNFYRQLSASGDSVIASPTQLAASVRSYAAGQRHSFFIKNDGTLWGRGSSAWGQLGAGVAFASFSPVQVGTGVAEVFTTAETSFALKTDGTLWATGTNSFGQFGALSTSAVHSSFVQVATGIAAVFPAATGENTFFLKTDGSLWASGRNDLGQLGLGHTRVTARAAKVRDQAYSVSSSGLHTLVLHAPPDAAPASPAILTEPASVGANFGERVALTVTATGDGVLTYQWYAGAASDTSHPIHGADTATLRLPAFAGSASYWVRVSNAAGSADSASATVTVSGAGSPAFRAWAEAAGLSGSRLSISADADGDGLPNLLEYAFRSAPQGADAGAARATPEPEFVRTAEGDFLVLSHRRRKDAPPSFTYESSTDLTTWDTQPLTPLVIDPDADGDGLAEEVSVALPLPPEDPTRFLRVRVSEP